jgi:hypothetical protein
MSKTLLNRLRTWAMLTAGVLAAFIGGAAETANRETREKNWEPDLVTLRKVTEKYRDVNVALKEGFIRDPMNMCDTADMMGRPAKLGAMGIHFFRPDLLGITGTTPRVDGNGVHTDFLQPSILIYEPQADGSLELVAVENLVFKKVWDAAHKQLPSYQGVDYDYMVDDAKTPIDEAHMFEPHYDRHVWIYRENPNGVFAQFNPNVTCRHHGLQGAVAENSAHHH